MGKLTGKSYRPSNGTEGIYFESEFCMNCINCHPNPEEKPQCEIMMNAFMHSQNEPEYPKEWQYDENDEPTCTAFKKWDWGNDDDEGGYNTPPEPEPYNPNQLVMDFMTEEIERNTVQVEVFTDSVN